MTTTACCTRFASNRERRMSASIGRAIDGRLRRTSSSKTSADGTQRTQRTQRPEDYSQIQALCPVGWFGVTIEQAVALVSQSRDAGKRIVFTNGAFDLLHPGHLRYLKKA